MDAEAKGITEGAVIAFVNWGNIKLAKIHKSEEGRTIGIDADMDLENEVR